MIKLKIFALSCLIFLPISCSEMKNRDCSKEMRAAFNYSTTNFGDGILSYQYLIAKNPLYASNEETLHYIESYFDKTGMRFINELSTIDTISMSIFFKTKEIQHKFVEGEILNYNQRKYFTKDHPRGTYLLHFLPRTAEGNREYLIIVVENGMSYGIESKEDSILNVIYKPWR